MLTTPMNGIGGNGMEMTRCRGAGVESFDHVTKTLPRKFPSMWLRVLTDECTSDLNYSYKMQEGVEAIRTASRVLFAVADHRKPEQADSDELCRLAPLFRYKPADEADQKARCPSRNSRHLAGEFSCRGGAVLNKDTVSTERELADLLAFLQAQISREAAGG